MKTKTKWLALPVLGLLGATLAFSGANAATINVPTDYSTIQAAISAAADGDTIQVGPGLYDENLDVNMKLSIVGSGSGIDPLVDTIIDPIGGLYGIFIHQPVNLKDLRVTGAPNHGIRVQSTSGRLAFTDVTWDNIASSANGAQGVEIHNGTDVSGMAILNSEFVENIGPGIRSGSDVTIDGVVITGCKFDQNSYGLYLQGTINNLTISGSSLDLNSAWGLYMSETGPIGNVAIENSSFNGNVGWGIVLWTPSTINGVSITGSSIDNDAASGYPYGKGVWVGGDLGTTDASATCNWWGDASGPSGEGSGSGDAVSADVNFTPWLIAPGGPCTGGLPPRQIKFQVGGELMALLDTITDGGDRSKLNEAIKYLGKSVSAEKWLDDAHPTPGKKGEAVFNEEKKTVTRLRELRNGNHTPLILTPTLLQGYIDLLVGADRQIAEIAIQEAIARNGNAGKISNAQSELIKGDVEAGKDHPDKAIDHYKNAWKNAIAA